LIAETSNSGGSLGLTENASIDYILVGMLIFIATSCFCFWTYWARKNNMILSETESISAKRKAKMDSESRSSISSTSSESEIGGDILEEIARKEEQISQIQALLARWNSPRFSPPVSRKDPSLDEQKGRRPFASSRFSPPRSRIENTAKRKPEIDLQNKSRRSMKRMDKNPTKNRSVGSRRSEKPQGSHDRSKRNVRQRKSRAPSPNRLRFSI